MAHPLKSEVCWAWGPSNAAAKEPVQTDGEGQLGLERLNHDLPFLFHFKGVSVSTGTLALV